MLSVEQLYVNYGEKEILHDVDLQVACGRERQCE